MSDSQTTRVDETDAKAYAPIAAKGLIGNLALLVKTAEGWGEGWADPDKLVALGIADKHAGPEGNAEDEAAERLYEMPLCVEATTTFEVVLGTGGPDSRLLFECARIDWSGDPGEPGSFNVQPTYDIRRVFYRYSWEGSADVELTGEDRETAEAFGRRVVPELAE